MLNADPTKVSARAKKRGLPQLGTLGAGNHYAEVQVVDDIYDRQVGIVVVGDMGWLMTLSCGSCYLFSYVSPSPPLKNKQNKNQTNKRLPKRWGLILRVKFVFLFTGSFSLLHLLPLPLSLIPSPVINILYTK